MGIITLREKCAREACIGRGIKSTLGLFANSLCAKQRRNNLCRFGGVTQGHWPSLKKEKKKVLNKHVSGMALLGTPSKIIMN